MEIGEIHRGLLVPALLTVAVVVIALASLLLHLLFPPWRNTPPK